MNSKQKIIYFEHNDEVWSTHDVRELERFKEAVLGWRENDWPEGFDRRTAELIAHNAKQAASAHWICHRDNRKVDAVKELEKIMDFLQTLPDDSMGEGVCQAENEPYPMVHEVLCSISKIRAQLLYEDALENPPQSFHAPENYPAELGE